MGNQAEDLAEEFIEDLECTGSGKAGNVFYRSNCFFSYGTHWVLARKDAGVLIINTARRSQSTDKQTRDFIRVASRQDKYQVFYANAGESVMPNLFHVADDYETSFKDTLMGFGAKPRRPELQKKCITDVADLLTSPGDVLSGYGTEEFMKYVCFYLDKPFSVKTYRSWIKNNAKLYPYLAELVKYTEKGKVSRNSVLAPYLGISKVPNEEGIGFKFLNAIKSKGRIAAAVEVAAVDNGYSLEKFTEVA